MGHVSEPTPAAGGPATSPSGPGSGALSPLTLWLVSCGGICALLFTAVYLIEGITRQGYDAWQQPISALSLGPGGWVQQVNFIVFGVLLIVSSVGWYRVERAAVWFPALQVISGLGLIGAGVFSMDPFPGYPPGAAATASTLHGSLHSVSAWVLIVSLALGCFTLGTFLGIFFVRLPRWRGWAIYSYLTGALILIFWALFVNDATAPNAGLVERLSAGSHALWLCVITAVVLAQQKRLKR